MGNLGKSLVVVSVLAIVSVAWTVPASDPNLKRDCKDLFCHFASADAHQTMLSKRDGVCPTQAEYDAEAGPSGIDFGGEYTAEGGGGIVDSKTDTASFPATAHVTDSDIEDVREGRTVDVWAKAAATSVWGTITADDSETDTCS